METTPSRTPTKKRKPYHVATCGRVKVPVYRRQSPGGHVCFMVANYATGKRRLDSHPTPELAVEAATKLSRQLSERQTLAASMTNQQAIDYASVAQKLEPLGISLTDAVSRFVEAYNLVGDVVAAAKFYRQRHKLVTPKPVADVVAELLEVKAARNASERYLQDLRVRLGKFAGDFVRDACNVTTA